VAFLLLVPPLFADQNGVVRPVAVIALGAVKHFGSVSVTITGFACAARVELLWPPLVGRVNPVKEVAQQVGLILEHVIFMVLVQNARPVGAAWVVP
jgi:hypothetical protein